MSKSSFTIVAALLLLFLKKQKQISCQTLLALRAGRPVTGEVLDGYLPIAAREKSALVFFAILSALRVILGLASIATKIAPQVTNGQIRAYFAAAMNTEMELVAPQVAPKGKSSILAFATLRAEQDTFAS